MFDALRNLSYDIDCLFFFKNAFSGHVLLQIAHGTIFSHYVAMGAGFIHIVAFHDVLVIESFENINFPLEHLQTWGTKFLYVEYLDSYLLWVFERHSFVDFAAVSWTDLFFEIDSVMADCVRVLIEGIGHGVGN